MAEDGRPSERGHWPVKSASMSWNVLRMWWELTKLVLTGRARYDVYANVEGFHGDVAEQLTRDELVFNNLEWVGGEDRFVLLNIEREG